MRKNWRLEKFIKDLNNDGRVEFLDEYYSEKVRGRIFKYKCKRCGKIIEKHIQYSKLKTIPQKMYLCNECDSITPNGQGKKYSNSFKYELSVNGISDLYEFKNINNDIIELLDTKNNKTLYIQKKNYKKFIRQERIKLIEKRRNVRKNNKIRLREKNIETLYDY